MVILRAYFWKRKTMTDEEKKHHAFEAGALGYSDNLLTTGQFTGAMSWKQYRHFNCITLRLSADMARDRAEAFAKGRLPMFFPRVNLLAIAFLGRGRDEFLKVVFTSGELTDSQVLKARAYISGIDHRAAVFYPTKAVAV